MPPVEIVSLIRPVQSRFREVFPIVKYGIEKGDCCGFHLERHPVIDQARNALDHIARVLYPNKGRDEIKYPCASIEDNQNKAKHHIERLHLDALKIWHYCHIHTNYDCAVKNPTVENVTAYFNYELAYCDAKEKEKINDNDNWRIHCYSFLGSGLRATDKYKSGNYSEDEKQNIKYLIDYYWYRLKPLAADYEIKIRLYEMNIAASCLEFWQYVSGGTDDYKKLLESFVNSAIKALVILIHYEYEIHITLKTIAPKTSNYNIYRTAEDIYEMLEEGNIHTSEKRYGNIPTGESLTKIIKKYRERMPDSSKPVESFKFAEYLFEVYNSMNKERKVSERP